MANEPTKTDRRDEDHFDESAMFGTEEFRDGFTMRTMLGALFVGFIMLPGAIYMGLVNGVSVGNAAQWVTIVLFVEIGKRSFVKLTSQELMILFWVTAGMVQVGARLGSAVAIFGGPVGTQIWDQYLRLSPQTKAFGIAHLLPRWHSPPEGHPALLHRTFMDAAWVGPLALIFFHSIMLRVVQLSGGYLLYRITRDVEQLPYPLAYVNASAATALAETSGKTETWRWRVFSIGAMLGISWGAIYLILPVVTGVLLPEPIMIIPIPFIDLSDRLGGVLPASAFGLFTDLGVFLSGFVLPFWVVVGSFLGSFLADIVLNPIFYHAGLLRRWTEGMDVIQLRMANNLDLYLSITMGLAFTVAIIGIVAVIYRLVSKSRELKRRRLAGEEGVAESAMMVPAQLKGRGDITFLMAFGIWAFGMLTYIIVTHFLVPTFNLWLLLVFAFLWSPLISYVSARMRGLTGSVQGMTFPFIRQAAFILSGYRGVAIWFAPVPMLDVGMVATQFVQLELTRTKFVSHVKATFVTIVLLFICSFIYWSVIWRMQPIPHSAYPFVQRFWPMHAFNTALWVSSTLGEGKNWLMTAFRGDVLLYSMGVGFAIYGTFALLNVPALVYYGMVSGVTLWVHRGIPMLAGALLGRFYFARKFGAQTWKNYTPIVLAGFGCGMGLVAIGSAGVALIARQVAAIIF